MKQTIIKNKNYIIQDQYLMHGKDNIKAQKD